MKIKELNLSDYTYRRICVVTAHGREFFAPDSDALLLSLYGEEELAAENGVCCTESGWLTITPEKSKKTSEE